MEDDTNRTLQNRNMPPMDMGDTFIISREYKRRRLLSLSGTNGSGDVAPGHEIALLIRGMAERVLLREGTPLTVGRADLETGFRPEIDLTPYGAQGRGVSRCHARLHVEHQQLYITDLESSNGTYIAGSRLPPNVPCQLHDGDQILLGSLGVIVSFT